MRIKISNLGPLKSIDMTFPLNNCTTVLIGAQASGKSTFAKAVYFCRTIKDTLTRFLLSDDFFRIHKNERYLSFLKRVRKSFMGCFGTTKHLNPFKIEFSYDTPNGTAIDDRKVSIYLGDDKYARIRFSKILRDEIVDIINQTSDLYDGYSDTSTDGSLYSVLMTRMNIIETIKNQAIAKIKRIFRDDYDVVYIPAGRSLLSSMSEQLIDVDERKMETAMLDFIKLIKHTKSKFGNKIDEMILDYTKMVKGQINNNAVELAAMLIKEILKAEYVNDSDGEKLYYDGIRWTKLMYGSSGQQESLWILLLAFTFILSNQKTFVIIEEPEAHLYPIAQRDLVKLISLLVNSTGSQVLITTHSPYILTSYNLLLHSARVENDKRNIGSEVVVPRLFRLNSCNFAAYMISSEVNGQSSKVIFDRESGLINAFEIDEISNIINAETNRLIDMEIKYDM